MQVGVWIEAGLMYLLVLNPLVVLVAAAIDHLVEERALRVRSFVSEDRRFGR